MGRDTGWCSQSVPLMFQYYWDQSVVWCGVMEQEEI